MPALLPFVSGAPLARAAPARRGGVRASAGQMDLTTTTITSKKLETMRLGQSDLQVPIIGVGAWAWGDRSGYWGYGKEYGRELSQQAYKTLMAEGLTFIDTAEVYGFGKSEEYLGEFMKEMPSTVAPQIASKFAPLPWRLTSQSLVTACKASLGRLQLAQMDLYMQHWPGFLPLIHWPSSAVNDAYIEGLAQVWEQKLAKAVGVSNFNEQRVRKAAQRLKERGTALASNQVQYSLLYRTPEKNGVLEACRENGVTLVAYSPLCQGLLTGKYVAGGAKPSGPRGQIFNDGRIREIQPLLATVKAVADERGKTMSQVALNWCICKGTLPIPGAKSDKQAADIAGAAGWRLSDGEVAELDRASDKVPTGLGAPFEKW